MKKLIIITTVAMLTFPIARAAEEPKPDTQEEKVDLGEWAIVGEGKETKPGVTEYALKNGGKLRVFITTDFRNFTVTDKDGRLWQKFTGGTAGDVWTGGFIDWINVSPEYPKGKQIEGGTFKPNIEAIRSGKGVIYAKNTYKLKNSPVGKRPASANNRKIPY